jgi:hypothetical protein
LLAGMKQMGRIVAGLYFLLTTFFCSSVLFAETQSKSVLISDFDETIFNTHDASEQIDKATSGIYQSGYMLVRVNHADLKAQNENGDEILLEELAREVYVPMADYRRLREQFAFNATNPGSTTTAVELSNGSVIFPGLYYFDPNTTLRRFRSDDSVNYLLDELIRTKEFILPAQPGTTHYGVSWPALELALTPNPIDPSKPILDGAVLTARGQSATHFQEFWKELAEIEGISPYVEPSLGVIALSHSQYDGIHFDQSLPEKKWSYVYEKLMQLNKTEIASSAVARTGVVDPKLFGRQHYLIVFEDDYRIFNYILSKLRIEVRSQRVSNVKVGLVCAATNFDFEQHVIPPNQAGGIFRSMIIMPNGRSRPMVPIEKIGEPIIYDKPDKQKKFEAKLLKKFFNKCPLSFY